MAPTATQLTEIVPTSGATLSLADPQARDWLTARYARSSEAYTRINMITTLTGSATGADGTSDSISSRADRLILGVIRADADAIVVGAQTVRAEGYTVPRTSTLVIVTATGNLSGHRLSDEALERVRLICPADSRPQVQAASPHLSVIPLAGDFSPTTIQAALTGLGMRRLVCEGGPGLASQFLVSGVVDELCVTSAPTVDPTHQPFIAVRERPETAVGGMLADDAGFSYLRLSVGSLPR